MAQVIRNWSDSNARLKQRDSLTLLISEDVLNRWVEPELSGKHGESRYYNNVAISTMGTTKSVLQRSITFAITGLRLLHLSTSG
jgi:hypothetical protein